MESTGFVGIIVAALRGPLIRVTENQTQKKLEHDMEAWVSGLIMAFLNSRQGIGCRVRGLGCWI